MIENKHISNQLQFDRKLSSIKKSSAENLHILTDFDRTLTKAFVEGEKSPTVIAQIRNGNYLSPKYVEEAHRLFDYYHPIEIDPTISREEKNKQMNEWWRNHFMLLIECGITENILKEVVTSQKIQFRDGVLDAFDMLATHNIPVVIMSAGPGDMIRLYLEQEGKLTNNVHIVANMFNFDESGKAKGIQEPVIHSLNKYETIIHNFPVFDAINDRKNVLLLGDSENDIGMVDGFEANTVLSVGFLNEKEDELIERYKKTYDVVLTGDPDFSEVNKIIKEIL